MKLEHGKKYVTLMDTIVGPLTQLHDGRFSYKENVWDESGAILTRHGQASLAASVLSITREYIKPDPDKNASEYKHEEVGVTMAVSPIKLEPGKKYVTNSNKVVGPIAKLDDDLFSWKNYEWDGAGIINISGWFPNDCILREYIEPAPRYTAAEFLDKVKDVVTGPREKEYGDKTENHARIAKLWNMWLTETKEDGDAITPYDVATMMLMVKLARLMQTPGHQDSHIDIAGYAACMEEIYDRQ